MWSVLAEFVVFVSWKACRWEKIECPPTEGVRGQKIWTPSFSVSTTPEEPNKAKKSILASKSHGSCFYDIAHHTISWLFWFLRNYMHRGMQDIVCYEYKGNAFCSTATKFSEYSLSEGKCFFITRIYQPDCKKTRIDILQMCLLPS